MGFSHPELQVPKRSWDDRMHELYDFLFNRRMFTTMKHNAHSRTFGRGAQPSFSSHHQRLVGVITGAQIRTQRPCPFGALPVDDDPELDGTDAAHPAWWRGQEYGFDAAMRLIERALIERPAGVISNERWQALRERIHALARQR